MADLNPVADDGLPPAPGGDDTVIDHPDEQSLAEAEDVLAAEEEGKETPGVTPPAADRAVLPPAGQEPPKPGATPPAPADQPGPTVPVARLAQETQRRRQAENDLAFERGRSKALEDMVKSGAISAEHGRAVQEGRASNPAQPPTPAEQLAAVRAEQRTLAKKTLEMDPEAYEAERQRLEDLVFDLRFKQAAPAAPAARMDDLGLKTATDQVASMFPILDTLTEDQLMRLAPVAVADMKRAGKPFDSNDSQSLLDLRTRVAVIADKLYDNGRGTAALVARVQRGRTPAPPAGGNGVQPATPPATGLPPQQGNLTPAQRAAKIAMERRQPPQLDTAGDAVGGADGLTEEAITQMTSEEIAALPPSILERIEKGTYQWR